MKNSTNPGNSDAFSSIGGRGRSSAGRFPVSRGGRAARHGAARDGSPARHGAATRNVRGVRRRPTHRAETPDPDLAGSLARMIQNRESDSLRNVLSMVRHPRSLVRPGARWRPPTLQLPEVLGEDAAVVAVRRHRVGTRARARIRGWSSETEPAYLLMLRFSATEKELPAATPEAWVRALVPTAAADAVHQLTGETAPTFCWFVDRDFAPVHSPASLFTAGEAA
ncbi:hypothetical protein [Corynebacterium frankenforstense]|uniref:hypothetical protein n=1 Tax=Corynebacterium frankenforstense TaxID=1230998 RepID=UPI0009FB1453|nr:hypothetical protein [Corynebacterium frankenforstense]